MSERRILNKTIEDAQAVIDRAKREMAQIEAEKKPKLRHGMAVSDNYGEPAIILKIDGVFQGFRKHGTSIVDVEGRSSYGVIQEDIFDDLQALSEDVEEFVCDDRIHVKRDGVFTKISIDGWEDPGHPTPRSHDPARGWNLGINDLDELILKLRQMKATRDRKNA